MFDPQFYLGWLFGLVIAPTFYAIFAIAVVLLFYMAVEDKRGWTVFYTLWIALVIWAKLHTLGIVVTWLTVLYYSPLYYMVGFVWATYFWSRVISISLERVIAQRTAVATQFHLAQDYFSNITWPLSAIDAQYLKELVHKHKPVIYSEAIHSAESMPALYALMAPRAALYKGVLVMQIAYWPIYALKYALKDVVHDAAMWFYNRSGRVFQRMSDNAFKKL